MLATGPQNIVNEKCGTDLMWSIGQFIDHDVTLLEAGSVDRSFPIEIPPDDAIFEGFHPLRERKITCRSHEF